MKKYVAFTAGGGILVVVQTSCELALQIGPTNG